MIKFLNHNQINRMHWDKCVKESEVNLPYALFDYLNVVSPNWGGVVFESENSYEWVFPLPIRKKWGLKYLAQPLFTQQLGFYYKRKPSVDERRQVINLLRTKYWLIDIADNCSCETTEDLELVGIDRLTHLLELSKSYEEIRSGYNSNRKRALKSIPETLTLKSSDSILKLLEMFELSKGSEVEGFDEKAKKLLIKLSTNEKIQNMFKVYYVENENLAIAGGFFVEFNDKLIFLFGATSLTGKRLNAMTYLFDKIIKNFSSTNKILDFEGSLIDGVSQFYRSFGGEKKMFKQMRYSKIPLFVRNEK